MRSSSRSLALLTRGELSEVAVIISLPVTDVSALCSIEKLSRRCSNAHLVIEHLALAGLSLGDQAIVQNIKHILTDILKLFLDLLAVFADDADMLV